MPQGGGHASGNGAPAEAPEVKRSRPDLLITLAWCAARILSPAGNHRGAKNAFYWLWLLMSPRARSAWKEFWDVEYYLRHYEDVSASRLAPAAHYLLSGAWEQRNPSSEFSTVYYVRRHPDIAIAGLNPLLHYALFGKAEQRAIAPVRGGGALAGFSPQLNPGATRQYVPLVSVVIPCFNYGHLLKEAIDSVLGQTFGNVEIIVVEGGSTDAASVEAVKSLAAAGAPKTTFYFRTEPHLAGDNRNFGIERASGPYICCLDADDMIAPPYLETALFLAEAGDYDFVYPSVQCFGESSGRWLVSDPQWPLITKENQVSTVALFRKQVWSNLGGFRDWGKGEAHVPEDWDFWLRAVAAGSRGKAIRAPLMLYRVKSGSLSRDGAAPMERWRERLRRENEEQMSLAAPGPRPASDAPRASWESLAEPCGGAPCTLFALPYFTEGGAEKILLALAEALRARGEKVIVLTTLELPPSMPDHLQRIGAATPFVYPLPALLAEREDLSADFIYYLLRRHEVTKIYLAGSDLVYSILRPIREAFPDISVIDQLFNDEIHFHTNRACASCIDVTIVPGVRIAEKLVRQHGEDPSRVRVIPHGVPLPQRAPREAATPEGMPAGFQGRTLVAFFGRLSPEKGPLDFVRIAARLARTHPGLRFVITGEGPDREAVIREIRKRKLGGVVYAPGFVPDVAGWIAASEVVVVPSRVDGMPLVIFEAQALSKTVIASRTGSIPEVIEDGVTGFLRNPGDLGGFAQAIAMAAESAELRQRIGRAARRRVVENYTDDVMLGRYLQIFDQIESKRNSSGAAGFSNRVAARAAVDCAPLVSVVIPCFEDGGLLEETIQSVLRQSLTNLEIIIVAGGAAAPASVAPVRRLAKTGIPRTVFCFREAPHSAAGDRNFGIERARGRYLCCLKPGTSIAEIYLEMAVFLLEFGGFSFVYSSSQLLDDENGVRHAEDSSWKQMKIENQVPAEAVFRRNLWQRLGGFRDSDDAAGSGDWDYWLRAVAAGYQGKAIREPLMRYRTRVAGLPPESGAPHDKQKEWVLRENRDVISLAVPGPEPAAELRRASWKSLQEPPGRSPCTLFALPFFTEGGAEKIFLALAEGLKARGEKVIVLTSLSLPGDVPDRVSRLRGVTPFVYPLSSLLWAAGGLSPDFLYYLLRRHHVTRIYLAGCTFAYQLLEAVKREFPGIRVVDQLFNDKVHLPANRACASLVDATIVPGNRIRDRLIQEHGAAPSSLRVIPHGVRLKPCAAPPEDLPADFAGKLIISFFGRMSAEKGPVDFVRVAARLSMEHPELRFVMTGDGPEREAVQREIAQHSLQSRVHTPGFVADVSPWIEASDVVVVPSHLDGMPLVVFEAQGRGKVVAASRTGSIPEVIEDGATGFLCAPGDIEGFAAAVSRAVRSPDLRRRIGEDARRAVLQNHTEAAMLRRYFELFDDLERGAPDAIGQGPSPLSPGA